MLLVVFVNAIDILESNGMVRARFVLVLVLRGGKSEERFLGSSLNVRLLTSHLGIWLDPWYSWKEHIFLSSCQE